MRHSIKLQEQRLAAATQSMGKSSPVIYKRVLDLLLQRNCGGHVLDFGAGVGLLTGELYRQGGFSRVAGADILSRPSGLADSVDWYCLDLNGDLDLPDEVFDCIVAVEVIEHLENPRAMFRILARLLAPGGTLVITTPNNESIRALLALCARGHFVAFGPKDYPAHITAVLAADLMRMAAENGLRDVQVVYTDRGCIPSTGLYWQSLLGSLTRGRRFSDNLALVARR